MALTQVTNPPETIYSPDDAMDSLLTKLDDAIDDMEQGRVLTVEDAWAEIDAINN